jgi:hypothetical protein
MISLDYPNKYLTKLLLCLFAAFALTALSSFSLPGSASAEPADNDQVYSNCLRALDSRTQKFCGRDGRAVIKDARAAAATICKNEGNQKEEAKCVVEEASNFIKQAADKFQDRNRRPTYGDFKKALDKILEEAKKESGGGPCKSNRCKGDPAVKCTKTNCDLVEKYVNKFIVILSVSFGVIAVASLIAGGIQYSMSAGDSQKVSLAKKRIFNTMVAVVAYLFLYTFLQFLIPGGVFNR